MMIMLTSELEKSIVTCNGLKKSFVTEKNNS